MKPIIAYSPPYGENYFREFEVFSLMHKCGIDLTKVVLSNSFSRMGVPYSPYPLIWRGPEEYHFEVIERQFNDILRHNPSARFIPMIDLNSPAWLVEKTGRDSFAELGECYLDPLWRQAVTGYLDALVKELESRRHDRIAAVYAACGRTQEWFDPGCLTASPLRVQNYPKWCSDHGKKLLALPEDGEFDRYSDSPVLPDHLVQWLEYGNSLTAGCAAFFFKRLRSLLRPEVPIGGVFGNIHDLGHDGHMMCEQLFREAPPDFYIGPSCNSEIAMGGAGGFQSALLMLKRYGIGYLHSCDRQMSTSFTGIGPGIRVPASGIQARQKNAFEDAACLKREFALSMVHGFSIWFFNIWGGAYSGTEVRACLHRCGTIWKEYAGRSTGSDAETLLVYSPEAALHCRREGRIGSQLRRTVLPEAGIPFLSAAVSDLYEADLSPYKLIVFQCVDYLSKRDERMIREKVCRDHRVVVWCNHPGVADEHGVRPDRMEALSGVPSGTEKAAEKQFGEWRSVAAPNGEACTPEIFRSAGKAAGLHFFTEDPDLKVWSSPEFLSAHTKNGGVKTITLKRKVRLVTELFSGKAVAENCSSFRDNFAAPDTKLYLLQD